MAQQASEKDTGFDEIIEAWNERFGELQKRKEAGEKVSNNEVRDIVFGIGADIYKKGLAPSTIDTSKKNAEFSSIVAKINKQKFPLSSLDDTSHSTVKVNAIQFAAIQAEEVGSKGEILAEIVRDSDYMPLKPTKAHKTEASNQEDSVKPIAILPTPSLEAPESSIEDESAKAAQRLMEKLAPPEDIARMPMPVNGFEQTQIQSEKSGPKHHALSASPMNDVTDMMPAQLVQMPTEVVRPIDNPKSLPKDALGRIIRT